MHADWPILSVLIWLPDRGRPVAAAHGRLARRVRPLARARRDARDLRRERRPLARLRHGDRGDAVRRAAAVDRRLQCLVPPRRRRHLDAAHRAHGVHHAAGRDRRMDHDREAPDAVSRLLPDPRGADDRRVRGDGCAALLRAVGGDADPDVRDHRGLGRAAAGVRHRQVLPVHLPGLGADAGGADLSVPAGRQLRDRRHAGDAARRSANRPSFSSRSCWRSRSRCRCGRCTPGCRMRTSRRRPVAR